MKLYVTFFALLLAGCCYAQLPAGQIKLSPAQQKDDIEFLKKQLFDAHANPFTEIDQEQYTAVFDTIERSIKDSADLTTFYKRIRPTISWLADEHAGFDIDTAKLSTIYKHAPVFLPFTLKKQGNTYLVDQLLTPVEDLKSGDVIVQVNNVPVAALVNLCARYTTGFSSQRYATALTQFGYLYGWATDGTREHFTITAGAHRGVIINGTDFKAWLNYRMAHAGNNTECPQMVSYTRMGNAGYINSCSFSTHNDKEVDSLSTVIDNIFGQVKKDGVKYLFIDVSNNGGGNSQIGDILINNFYAKPYLGYQCNWRRSDEYLKLLQSWGVKDSVYASKPAGSILHFDAGKIFPFLENPNRFNGKVYIIVGDGTFSSAMMFGTIIKDNHIATLVGQTPQNGHPDHFGEVYNTVLPNSKIGLRFGVKEWIRPAGKISDNNLRPNIIIEPGTNTPDLIKQVINNENLK